MALALQDPLEQANIIVFVIYLSNDLSSEGVKFEGDGDCCRAAVWKFMLFHLECKPAHASIHQL